MNVKDVDETQKQKNKRKDKKKQKKNTIVGWCCPILWLNPISLFTADQTIHNRDDILVTRDMFIWTYSISCSFCTVFFLYITELCILTAQTDPEYY